MDKNEIIARLERLARCAIHTVGEPPFVMSLDDGIAVHEAIDLIKEAKPTADVAPVRHGRWSQDAIYYGEDGSPCIVDICTECGAYGDYADFNYCPNCGAKMDEGETKE